MKVKELINWTEAIHDHYCDKAQEFITAYRGPGIYFKIPSIKWFAKMTGTAAKASYMIPECEYNLAWLLAVEKDYRQTIAHEVAHILTHQIDYYAHPHGDLFKFILEHVFHMERKTTHRYSILAMNGSLEKAKLYLELLKKIEVLKNKTKETERS